MNATQIKAQFESMYRSYTAGNIGWRNYKQTLEKMFTLLLALTDIIAKLESKSKENENG